MKNGYWVNFRTGRTIGIDEHELDIRNPAIAKKLGVRTRVFGEFIRYVPGRDRLRFLLFVLRNAPVMRVRGHGVYVSFEYASRTDASPLRAVRVWCRKQKVGPATFLVVVNMRTGVTRSGFVGTGLTKGQIACDAPGACPRHENGGGGRGDNPVRPAPTGRRRR